MNVVFFDTPADLRAWLEVNHGSADELWVGFHRRDSGRSGITWREAVDEALCFGWIDGVRRRVDRTSYANRFTPRRPRSIWSAVNIARVEDLSAEGRMRPAGLAAFARRDPERQRRYSHEQAQAPELSPEYADRFRTHPAAWGFFESQAPSYRRQAVWWVMSAKREETRDRRLALLIAASADGRRAAPFVASRDR
jgi:uncharacterized protein YdeI (YjbR/CyaY-like superfamily)